MNEEIAIRLERLSHGEGLPLPCYQTGGSSGMDVCAAVKEPVVIEPGRIKLIPTGFKMEIPEGFEIQIRPRSGLALKHGIMLPNAPGTIDADYRGELQVIVLNGGGQPFTVDRGLRIAQLVLCRVDKARWEIVDQVEETPRGGGGFGHTGH